MTTAGDIAGALHQRYNVVSQGREGERWVCIEQARSGAGFAGNNGSCDLLAVNTWQSQGMQLIGHEIKVSYSDWRVELANPEKAERFARYCNRWFVVVPSDLADRVRDELPATWGLMSLSDCCLTEIVRAPIRDPAPVPTWWWVGWLAQLDRRYKRRLPELRGKIERLEAHSALLNRVGWRIAEVLGDIQPGATEHWSEDGVLDDLERLLARSSVPDEDAVL